MQINIDVCLNSLCIKLIMNSIGKGNTQTYLYKLKLRIFQF